MKINALNRKTGGNAVAVAACLLVALGWGSAEAFNSTHSTDGLTGWTKSGSGNTWGVVSGYAIPNGGSSQDMSFLINDEATTGNGEYEVEFARSDSIGIDKQPPSLGGGLVFRYNSTNQYYYLSVIADGNNGSMTVALFKNQTYVGQSVSSTTPGYVDSKTFTDGTSQTSGSYKFKIVMTGGTFAVTNMNTTPNQTQTLTDSNNPILTGKMGYAAKMVSWGQNSKIYFIRYKSCKWTDAAPACANPTTNPITGYNGYYAWNTKSPRDGTFAGGLGNWNTTDKFWSASANATSLPLPCNESAWPSTAGSNNALFYTAAGANNTVTLNGTTDVVFGKIDFVAGGYTIGGAGKLAPFGSTDGTITVADTRTATISAPVSNNGNSARSITKAGAGTLVLSGANTYGGTTTVSAGTLDAIGVGAINGRNTSSITISTGATLGINVADSGTLTKGITGGGTLTKTGSGELTLSGTGGAGKSIDTLKVSAGTLNIPTPVSGSADVFALTVNRSFSLPSGATLKVGIPTTASWTTLTGGTPTTVTLGGNLEITPPSGGLAENTYTLFGGGSTTKFGGVKVGSTVYTRDGTSDKWITPTGTSRDSIILTYSGSVKFEYKKAGSTPPPTTYTLTVVRDPTNGGTTTPTASQAGIAAGTAVEITATAGGDYNFNGWVVVTGTATVASATSAATTVTLSSNATIRANFVLKGGPPPGDTTRYLLTIIPPLHGTIVVDPTSDDGRYQKDQVVSLKAKPDEGYEFKGWEGALTGVTVDSTVLTMSSNSSVGAIFEESEKTFTLSITQGANGTIAASPTSSLGLALNTYTSGAKVVITATPNSDYTFSGWGGGHSGNKNPDTLTMDRNWALTGTFVQKDTKFTLTIEIDPPNVGKVTLTPGNQLNYAPNAKVVLFAEPLNAGWAFARWGEDHSGSTNPDTITMTVSKTVKAVFEQDGDIPKLISIDSAVYLKDSTVFAAYFQPDSAIGGTPYYTWELIHGDDTVAYSPEPVRLTYAAPGTATRIRVTLVDTAFALSAIGKSAIEFDSKYTINVRVVTNDGTALSSTERADIAVGAFVEQTVTINMPTKNKAAVVDNGKFRLATKDWRLAEGFSGSERQFKVTVYDASGDDAAMPAGFISLSKDYKYIVNYGGTLGYLETPFTIWIKADSIPSGYGAGNVSLYRYVKGGWNVVFDMDAPEQIDGDWYVSGRGGDLKTSGDVGVVFRLMVNTKTPSVAIGNTTISTDAKRSEGYYKVFGGSAITPGSDRIVVGDIVISSNVSNTATKVMYATADDKNDSLKTLGALKADGSKEEISFPSDSSRGNISGVLMYLIIDNGTVSDTVNLSRQVKFSSYRTAAEDYHRGWAPFGVGVSLDSTKIDKVFRDKLFTPEELEELGESGLPIDDKVYRLVRWLPRPNGGDGGLWTEYKNDTRQTFLLSPGRLMWLRTKSNFGSVDLGAAVTASLTDTFAFRDTLKARQWTDFVLPFSFKVRVKDILGASVGAAKYDSLYFYTWVKSGNSYQAKRLYEWDTDDADTAFNGPFTVYNGHRNRNIVLRVPPRPSYISPVTAKALAKTAAGGSQWHYAINVGVDDVPGLASLRIGGYDSERIAPAPPTLGSRSAVIVSDDGSEIGGYLTPDLLKSGRTFKLRFINGEKQKTAFKFSAEASAGVPEKMQIMFVDAATGATLGGSAERSITVAGNSYSDVYAVVGSRDYLNKTAVGPSVAKFAVGRVAVNRTARSVRVQYFVPLAGTDRVEMSVYNLKGRLVWKNTEKVRQSSWNTMEWRSRESRGGAAAAGLYIIRVRAISVTGKTTGVDNRRITFAR